MIHISNLKDTHKLAHDPEMWREVYGYLSCCIAAILEYSDEDEDCELNFLVLTEEDLPRRKELSTPEESVRIDIFSAHEQRRIYRIVYPTEVLFISGEHADQFPLALPAL